MQTKKYLFIAFALLVLVQLLVPFQMIWKRENVWKKGQDVKFRMAPVDPVHPLRGRYINLHFSDDLHFYQTGIDWKRNQKVRVYLTLNKQGFARIDTVTAGAVPDKELFVKAKVDYVVKPAGKIALYYPFERFYLEETRAPAVEKKFMELQAGQIQNSYALLKIHKGDAVITDLFLNGKSIRKSENE